MGSLNFVNVSNILMINLICSWFFFFDRMICSWLFKCKNCAMISGFLEQIKATLCWPCGGAAFVQK